MSTTNLVLATPAHGAEVDTWDVPLNANSNILDAAFGSVTSKALTNVNVTLTATEAQSSVLRFSGILTGNVIINVSAIRKEWNCQNNCTGNFVITISGGSGNVVGLPPGESTKVQWDGTNCSYTALPHFIGGYWDDSGAAVPAWVTACTVPPYLLCDGTTFSAVTYPYLNTKLGGNTLPDFRGRMAAFLDGGTSRITTAGSGIDGAKRFADGGAQNVVMVQANLPVVTLTTTIAAGQGSHNHSSSYIGVGTTAAGGGQNGPINTGVVSTETLPAMSGTTPLGGSATALNKMPPTTIAGIRMIRAA